MFRACFRKLRGRPAWVLASSLALAAGPAVARDYDISLHPNDVAVTPVSQPPPAFPDGDFRRRQEGWVRINFVVDAEGRAVDPIVVDSLGGIPFERAALEAMADWRFEAPGPGDERASNDIEIRFEIAGHRDRASRSFLRRYRNIARNLYYDDVEKARIEVDMANEFGGWNLYELTMLSLLNGRVEGAEDNAVGQLEHYRRGLAISNATALDGDERRDVLAKIFEIEFDSGQYGSAAGTLDTLRAEPGSEKDLAGLADKVQALEAALVADAPVRADATLYTPCDCDDGDALWTYMPARRRFTFDNVDGNVEHFEARCTTERLSGDVIPGMEWTLPEESCRIFVFGDDDASFEFVGHAGDGEDDDGALAGTNAEAGS